ncbi:MAG TPA: protein-arginine deiminase family protein [Bryobacteraceae bacterium]|nr:protein-arginine deiminase family protein [Bryobacteraceae bacterium]
MSTAKPCVKRDGAIWVHVVDDNGGDVNGAQVSVGGESKPTVNGVAAFDPKPAGSYDVIIRPLTDPLDQLYDPPVINAHKVGVVNGRIAYVLFELVRRATLTVIVRYSRTLVALDGDVTVSVPETVRAGGQTIRDTTGSFMVSRGTYTISTALSDQLPGCAIAAAHQNKRVLVPPGGNVTETIYIEPAGEVKVKVTRADTGADVPGVNVAINGPASGSDNTGADGTFGVRNAGAGRYAIALTLSADLLDQFLEPAAIAPIDLAQSQISNTPVVLPIRPAPLLQMFLNGQRRDGQVVDDAPTNNNTWEWGTGRTGAILTVRPPVKPAYDAGTPVVVERSLLRLQWQNDVRTNWQGTLAVDQPDRVRIYRANTQGAPLLLGGPQRGPILLHNDVPIRSALEGATHQCDLWMEAFDYPMTETEADWLVRLTLTFQWRGNNTNQSAVLRIAPWIMASDLEPTLRVYVRTTEGRPDHLSNAVIAFGATGFPLAQGANPKGFARDVMKSGYSVGPHHSGIVIQSGLDSTSPLLRLPTTAAANSAGGVMKKRAPLVGDTNGQDNGGNLLVSPRSPRYPWGRIVYGEGDRAILREDDRQPALVCRSEGFYNAQKLQRPIRVNSGWLRVGHADEMLSFVRATDGSDVALLISPRLGYILLKAVASSNLDFPNATALVTWAKTQNVALMDAVAGAYASTGLTAAIRGLDRVPIPDPFIRIEPVATTGNNPVVPPPLPVNPERFVILRDKRIGLLEQLTGRPVPEALRMQYEAAMPLDNPPDSFELWVHATKLLETYEARQFQILQNCQPIIDTVRRDVLIRDLEFTVDRILEVPVLLNLELGQAVAMTGDSVNLLQTVAARGAVSNCLVPKPFGPVFGGEYVFENYLTAQFASLHLQTQYCADDRFHIEEGEIHCGTNQTHPALTDAGLRKWWEWVEPPV